MGNLIGYIYKLLGTDETYAQGIGKKQRDNTYDDEKENDVFGPLTLCFSLKKAWDCDRAI